MDFNLSQLSYWVSKHVNTKKRLQFVVTAYIIFLMATHRKHTAEAAARFMRKTKPNLQFFLKNNSNIAIYQLGQLSKKQARQFCKLGKALADGSLPWSYAILVDATPQKRSTRHTENSQIHNHGKGYFIGHQWTNIVLLIGHNVIPLPPIPFYTKKYCKENNIEYQTENERVVEYLSQLNLEEYLGYHSSERIVVLADSGYDDKKIENFILSKKWHFIISLKSKRGVKSITSYKNTPKSKDWKLVSIFFKDYRKIGWKPIKLLKGNGKKKWMEFRTRQIIGYLKNVGKVQLICSKFKTKSKKVKRKHLVCSDLKATPRQILIGYRLRWEIEIFHKEVKMFLGFEDVSSNRFSSVVSHVHWVYCAYILLKSIPLDKPPDEKDSVAERKLIVDRTIKKQNISNLNHLLTKINGIKRLKNNIKEALSGSLSCECPIISGLMQV